jgi:hypothetical protein
LKPQTSEKPGEACGSEKSTGSNEAEVSFLKQSPQKTFEIAQFS